jgi:thiamine-phosphate pyrophosphorylase
MLKVTAAGIQVPIVAIGGILPGDVPGLRAAGIHGVAISGALTNADDKQALVKQIDVLYS